jgi:H+/Cl- antiporter ClcA
MSFTMNTIRQWVFQQLPFVLLIVFILGTVAGVYFGKLYYSYRLNEAVKLEGFVNPSDNHVYTVKLKP